MRCGLIRLAESSKEMWPFKNPHMRKVISGYSKNLRLMGILPSDIFVNNPAGKINISNHSTYKKLFVAKLTDELKIAPETRKKLAYYAKKLYKFTVNNSKEIIENMQKTFGDIEGATLEFRTKSNESLLEKIYRKIKNTIVKKTELQKSFETVASQKEKEELQALINEQDKLRVSLTNNFAVIKNKLKDAFAARFILSKPTADNIDLAVEKIIAGIEKDEFAVTHIKNYAADSEHLYFSKEQVSKILSACHNKGIPVENIEKFKSSGYTTTQLCLVFKNGVRCELQIRGDRVHRIAKAEHYLYEIREQKGDIENFSNPVYAALKLLDLDSELKEIYENYLKKCYHNARNLEMSIPTSEVHLPGNIPKVLDIENIICMCENQINTKTL